MVTEQGNALVAQSGGPTAAINATLSGVIRASHESTRISHLYGAFNGIDGILNERFSLLDYRIRTLDDLRLLETTPAAALGSCRVRLGDPEQQPQVYEKVFDFFRRHDIRYFFYIGGNDSMDTLSKLSTYASMTDSHVRMIGVPKTIDNDLAETDHTPGYGSAAKYIAVSVQEIARDAAVYASRSLTVVEVMGRDAGWLTAAAALPRLYGGSAADLVYLPERPFSFERFFRDVEQTWESKPNVVAAVAEGLRLSDGRYVGESSQSGDIDVFGHRYLSGAAREIGSAVRRELGCKVRDMSLDVSQRCASHSASLTDIRESVAIGKSAVRAAVRGATNEMMVFRRVSKSPYKVEIGRVSLERVANEVRRVPEVYINESGNNVTDECLRYMAPLITGEANVRYENGLPVHFVIPISLQEKNYI